MLRIHFLQQWYALSDPGVEEALYDSEAMRRFVGVDLGREAAPDESTVLQFRHLLERHGRAKQILVEVNRYLAGHGMKLSRGTTVDATIIAAPSSTKNQGKARDPEMHQTKKGNQWYFGMKAHIGVDVNTGLVHTATATAANVADVAEVPNLLRGKETSVYADAGYIGADKRVPKKHDRVWFIAEKRSKVNATEDDELRDLLEQIEHKEASVRAKVEHPFRIVKRQFGYFKVRYRGLAKNGAQVMTLFALANLWMARRTVLMATG
jgi:IS5 family transposase